MGHFFVNSLLFTGVFFFLIIWAIVSIFKKRTPAGLEHADFQKLHELLRDTEELDARVINLEKILDAEVPQWRDRL